VRIQSKLFALLAGTFVLYGPGTFAATIPVPPGGNVQDAIDAAVDGDTIALQTGVYPGDIDFMGKAIAVVGVGEATVISGSGAGPVVRFVSGETSASKLDSVTITGGSAPSGGGILIENARPTILRNFITRNSAVSRGAAIFIEGAAAQPLIANNLIAYNDRIGFGDPHGIQTSASSPVILNNTIVRGDSNGIFLSGGGAPVVMNNIIGRNGSRGSASEARRGRGICNFVSNASILHNLFWRNAKSALLQSGQDFRRIRRAQRALESPGLTGNRDGSPKFVRRKLPADADDISASDFALKARSRAIGNGNPDPAYDNLDGSPNTIGHSGGPLAAP
jgi:parallel beta-helix repeat protein